MEDALKTHLTLEKAFAYLTSRQVRNFYAQVVNSLERVPAPGCGTMGVTPHKGRYVMIYDPAFVQRVSVDELVATLEHEVLHIILHHIPRYMRLRQIYENRDDKALFEMSSNTAMDLADNCLLAKNWEAIKEKPPAGKKEGKLGYWIMPHEFDPPLPWDLDYESYHKLVTLIFKQRLNSPPSELYKLAQQALQPQKEALEKALQGASGNQPPQSPPQPGQGQGQGQGPPQPDPGGGQSTQDQIDKLDPVDQLAVKLLIEGLRKHMAWQMSADASKDEGESHKLEDHGRELLKEAVDNHEKSRGTMPGHIQELIRQMLLPPTVPWTQFLHNIVQRTRQTKKIRGMARPSKTLAALGVMGRKAAKELEEATELGVDPIGLTRLKALQSLAKMRRVPPFPGVKHSNKFTILYVVDTSGSMSRKELQLALAELQHIQKSDSDVKIIVIYADAGLCLEYDIGSSDELDLNMLGRGGTDFEPAFIRAKELLKSQDRAPDILIYATDGYAPPPVTKLPIPVVWLITPGGAIPCDEAGHIVLEMKDYQLGESY